MSTTSAEAFAAFPSDGPQTAFEIVAPVDGATDVTTPMPVSGNAPDDGGVPIEVQIVDITNGSILHPYQPATFTPDTWSLPAQTIPQNGETIRIDARRPSADEIAVDNVAHRFGGTDTNRIVPITQTVNAGDVIVVAVWRSNGAGTGPFATATANGFSVLGHINPVGNFRMIGTVLTRTATGGENVAIVDYTPAAGETPDGETNAPITVSVLRGVDPASLSVDFVEVTGTAWSYPAMTGQYALHAAATQNNTDISSSGYPPGDTQIAHGEIAFRNGGVALSGGGTEAGPHSQSSNGTVATISFDSDGSPLGFEFAQTTVTALTIAPPPPPPPPTGSRCYSL